MRDAAPEAELIVDANEAWTPELLDKNFTACARAGVALVEQPRPADADAILAQKDWPVPVCADESAFDRAGLLSLRGKYDLINAKLDKTGALTEALALAEEAEQLGFGISSAAWWPRAWRWPRRCCSPATRGSFSFNFSFRGFVTHVHAVLHDAVRSPQTCAAISRPAALRH